MPEKFHNFNASHFNRNKKMVNISKIHELCKSKFYGQSYPSITMNEKNLPLR